jgi:hypothetical protein
MQSLRDTWQADEDTISECLHQIKDTDVLDTVTGHIESLKKVVHKPHTQAEPSP